MANRRMFANSIINSARFLQMPATTRLLYYDLGMKADDDGFVESFSVLRMTNASEDDLRLLHQKGYIFIVNDDLLVYICDWLVNNQIRKDRYAESIYKELIPEILRTISECKPKCNQLATKMATSGSRSIVEDSIGKVSIVKESKAEEIIPSVPYQQQSRKSKKNEEFESFWQAYPKKKNKADARKAFDKVKVQLQTLLDAIDRQKRSAQWSKDGGQFIPYPASWLNKGAWDDELEPQTDASGRRYFDESEWDDYDGYIFGRSMGEQ